MKKRLILLAAITLAGAGCSDSSGSTQSVTLNFEAVVGAGVFVIANVVVGTDQRGPARVGEDGLRTAVLHERRRPQIRNAVAGVVVGVGAVAPKMALQIVPQILDGVQLRTVRRQLQ